MSNDIQAAVARLNAAIVQYEPKSLFKTFNPPDDGDLDAVEKALGMKLPADYRYFLKNIKGSELGFYRFSTLNKADNRYPLLQEHADGKKFGVFLSSSKTWVVIATELCGNYFCLKPDGSVIFWDHEELLFEEENVDEDWEDEAKYDDLAACINQDWIDGQDLDNEYNEED